MSTRPTLKALHSDTVLSTAKLATFEKWSTDKLVQSLGLGQEHCLKAKPDGTMLDGHHRVYVLKSRAFDVNTLAREVMEFQNPSSE